MILIKLVSFFIHSENLRMRLKNTRAFADFTAKKVGLFCRSFSLRLRVPQRAHECFGESEIKPLGNAESRIRAAARPGIKNQSRCAARNQESRITRGGQHSYSGNQRCACFRLLGCLKPAVDSGGDGRADSGSAMPSAESMRAPMASITGGTTAFPICL